MCREVEKIAMAERIETNVNAIRKIMAKMFFSVEEAMQLLELPEEEKAAVRKQIAQ